MTSERMEDYMINQPRSGSFGGCGTPCINTVWHCMNQLNVWDMKGQ